MRLKVGSNIQRLRIKNYLTQEQLAELIDVSRQTVYKWEADISLPKIDKLEILMKVLNSSLEELLF